MRKSPGALLCCWVALAGCPQVEQLAVHSSHSLPSASPKLDLRTFLPAGSGARCQGDADCPAAELCNPERDQCMSAYPEPRWLEMPLNPKEDCWLVTVYFSYNSAELSTEAARWLSYDIRCLRSLTAPSLLLKGHADAHGPTIDNQKLSSERGNLIKSTLIDAGLQLPIEVRTFEDSKLLRPGKSEKEYAYNRRVEFWPR